MAKKFQGPVRPTDDVRRFREEGITVPSGFQGPVPEGADESAFRKTGRTFVSGGGGGGGSSGSPILVSEDAITSQDSRETPAQATARTSQQARAIREEARRRNVDISTPARERGFLNRLERENRPSFKDIAEGKKTAPELFFRGVENQNQNQKHVSEVQPSNVGFIKQNFPFFRREIERFEEFVTTANQKITSGKIFGYPVGKDIGGGYRRAKYIAFVPFVATKNIVGEFERKIPERFVYEKASLNFARDFIPTNEIDIALLYGGAKAFKYAPKFTTTALTGFGGYRRFTAKTEQEKARANIEIALPFVAEYGVRKYSLKKQLKEFESKLKTDDPKSYEQYLKSSEQARSFSLLPTKNKPLDFGSMKYLEGLPKTQKAVKEYLINQPVILGGSLSQRSQLEEGISSRRPKDVDIYVEGITEKSQKRRLSFIEPELKNIVKKSSLKELQSQGFSKTKAQKKSIFLARNVFDIKTAKQLQLNVEQVYPFYKPSFLSITKSPEGFKILSLEAQAQRKVIGGFLEKYATGKIREKDIPDFLTIKKSFERTKSNLKIGGVSFQRPPKTQDLNIQDFRLVKGRQSGNRLSGGEYYSPKSSSVYLSSKSSSPFYKPKDISYPIIKPVRYRTPTRPRKLSPNISRIYRTRRPRYSFADPVSTILITNRPPIIPSKPKRFFPGTKIPFISGDAGGSKGKSKPKFDDVENILYTESFVSKVLELPAVKVKKSDFKKFASKSSFTGLGIKRLPNIKGISGERITERSLSLSLRRLPRILN